MREERFGVVGTVVDGIFFSDGPIPGAVSLGPIAVEINRQNANLAEVKKLMAEEVHSKGATAVQSFRYGQRARKWWRMALNPFFWDAEDWFGEGDACSLPPE